MPSRRRSISLWSGTIVRVAWLFSFVLFATGISRAQPPAEPDSPDDSQPLIVTGAENHVTQHQSNDQVHMHTFAGRIVADNGVFFLLRDGTKNTRYHLDDQESASRFDGERVLVSGVLNGFTDTIQVRSIQKETPSSEPRD